MAHFSQSILDEIRERVSIVSYIGEHVPLKKIGRNCKGLCPFHAEKTPSFIVSDEKEIFHCFGCGEGGNIFSFVMKFEGISFPEAVEHLADRAGVELPKADYSKGEMGRVDASAKRKKLLFRVNQISAQFFRERLKNGSCGEQARNYLKSRGISVDISTQHFLGYAEDSWDALFCYLKKKNVPPDLALELGLVRRKDNRSESYDFFRGRLIFPIISHRSEVVGFGGRDIKENNSDTAKYINSPDSAIYHKSHLVYALNVAGQHIRQQDSVIIVEGYMDLLALNQAGIFNVVAPLGTALTMSHIKLLMRFSKNMVLVFDGDDAGVNAALRSLPSFVEAKIMPKVVILPSGQDPDDWIKLNSKESFAQIVDSSDLLFEWFIKRKTVDGNIDAAEKTRVISEMKPYFERIGDSVEYIHYRKLLADGLRIDENDLARNIEYIGRPSVAINRGSSGSTTGTLWTEKLLLSLMLEYPNLIARVKDRIDPSYFTDGSFKTLYELLIAESSVENFSVGRMLDKVADEELLNMIHSFSVDEEMDEDAPLQVVDDCVKHLTKNKLSKRLRVISAEIKAAEEVRNDEKVLELIDEKNKLLSQSM